MNDIIRKKKNAIRELKKINDKLAQRENEERYKNLLELEKLQEDAAENMTLSIQKLNEKTVLIQNLNAEKKNIKFAASKMNRYLAYIFLAHDRLKLVVDNGHYAVEVRGHRIKLKDLSEGEKNAIALCYFFLKIQADKDEQHQFEEKLFIVLDDPISSFDYYNKVGVFSFLRMMIAAIKNGNNNSKFLIFTHQVESVFHFEKFKSDSIDSLNYKCWTLSKKNLTLFSHNLENEYSLLFKEVYYYATQSEGYEKMEHTVGNAIRRVVEGFATFFYRQSTEKLTRNNEVLQKIPKKYQAYYENLMYRLSLNSDSHLSYQARHATETEFYSLISQNEKIKLAKSLLFFLHLIDELHVIAHLSDAKENAVLDSRKHINIIKSWEKELFGEDTKIDSA